MCTHAHTHTHTYIYMYKYRYIQTHTHTNTQENYIRKPISNYLCEQNFNPFKIFFHKKIGF